MGKVCNSERYRALARQAAAEGIVLCKNDRNALPLAGKVKVAVFGRSQFHYYKSGTGSGGLVHVAYEVGILDALKGWEDFSLNGQVLSAYEKWNESHPFEEGDGWAKEPWNQEEMPLSPELVAEAAEESEAAIVVIGRTAGEDKDNSVSEGSFLLTALERDMLSLVCSRFSRTIVLLNVGNVIDMSWVADYDPAAVLYVWQGGQEGGNGVLDVLTGRVNPCGKLADTICADIQDCPSMGDFGREDRVIYAEDIYVGYRYFETFAREKVLYPFGFGLSYTSFLLHASQPEYRKAEASAYPGDKEVAVSVRVENIGDKSGREVVQLYCCPPQGRLGKPLRALCGFAKTGLLAPGEGETVQITCPAYLLASYDDSGKSGHRFCYVLEEGQYDFYVGTDVRSATIAGSIFLSDTVVLAQLSSALAPVREFERLMPDEKLMQKWEKVPVREYSLGDRIAKNLPPAMTCQGDQGFRLKDVAQCADIGNADTSDASTGKISMEDFLGQLTDEELCTLLRGEGLCSPKVTPGTAGAFGGVTDALAHYGIPVGCCSDGPSGIRMDCGTLAFSMPNGTCLACTFDEVLLEELFAMTGQELREQQIDTLLGPGMNIHRTPLNGRNFEYFSEDPFLSGKMAVAQLRGLHRYGVTGTIKHFACNNQESHRFDVDAVLSERAAREIYLKGFEMAVREGGAFSIMTSYNIINGLHAASNFDLVTVILRGEWGYQGLVMTDWGAKGNTEGSAGSRQEFAIIVRCGNDLYMVTEDSAKNTNGDDLQEALKKGRLFRGELVRCAERVCRVLLRLPVAQRMPGLQSQ